MPPRKAQPARRSSRIAKRPNPRGSQPVASFSSSSPSIPSYSTTSYHPTTQPPLNSHVRSHSSASQSTTVSYPTLDISSPETLPSIEVQVPLPSRPRSVTPGPSSATLIRRLTPSNSRTPVRDLTPRPSPSRNSSSPSPSPNTTRQRRGWRPSRPLADDLLALLAHSASELQANRPSTPGHHDAYPTPSSRGRKPARESGFDGHGDPFVEPTSHDHEPVISARAASELEALLTRLPSELLAIRTSYSDEMRALLETWQARAVASQQVMPSEVRTLLTALPDDLAHLRSSSARLSSALGAAFAEQESVLADHTRNVLDSVGAGVTRATQIQRETADGIVDEIVQRTSGLARHTATHFDALEYNVKEGLSQLRRDLTDEMGRCTGDLEDRLARQRGQHADGLEARLDRGFDSVRTSTSQNNVLLTRLAEQMTENNRLTQQGFDRAHELTGQAADVRTLLGLVKDIARAREGDARVLDSIRDKVDVMSAVRTDSHDNENLHDLISTALASVEAKVTAMSHRPASAPGSDDSSTLNTILQHSQTTTSELRNLHERLTNLLQGVHAPSVGQEEMTAIQQALDRVEQCFREQKQQQELQCADNDQVRRVVAGLRAMREEAASDLERMGSNLERGDVMIPVPPSVRWTESSQDRVEIGARLRPVDEKAASHADDDWERRIDPSSSSGSSDQQSDRIALESRDAEMCDAAAQSAEAATATILSRSNEGQVRTRHEGAARSMSLGHGSRIASLHLSALSQHQPQVPDNLAARSQSGQSMQAQAVNEANNAVIATTLMGQEPTAQHMLRPADEARADLSDAKWKSKMADVETDSSTDISEVHHQTRSDVAASHQDTNRSAAQGSWFPNVLRGRTIARAANVVLGSESQEGAGSAGEAASRTEKDDDLYTAPSLPTSDSTSRTALALERSHAASSPAQEEEQQGLQRVGTRSDSQGSGRSQPGSWVD